MKFLESFQRTNNFGHRNSEIVFGRTYRAPEQIATLATGLEVPSK